MIYTTEELLVFIERVKHDLLQLRLQSLNETVFIFNTTAEKAAERLDAIADILRDAEPRVLTLEQLREMDGQPVWVVSNGKSGWVIIEWNYVDRISHSGHLGLTLFRREYNKSWVAYTSKPKEAE